MGGGCTECAHRPEGRGKVVRVGATRGTGRAATVVLWDPTAQQHCSSAAPGGSRKEERIV